jgi:hypothetical protein
VLTREPGDLPDDVIPIAADGAAKEKNDDNSSSDPDNG